jgi:hypothetical protein
VASRSTGVSNATPEDAAAGLRGPIEAGVPLKIHELVPMFRLECD